MTATDKATDFKDWLNTSTKLTNEQKGVLADSLDFYSQIPAEAGNYDGMVAAGMSFDKAKTIYDTVSSIVGSGTNGAVTTQQKRSTIVQMAGLSEDEKLQAMSVYFKDSDSNHTYQKYATVYKNYSIPVSSFVAYQNALADMSDDTSYSQAEVIAALKSITGSTNDQRAILFAMQNKTWKSNPFHGGWT